MMHSSASRSKSKTIKTKKRTSQTKKYSSPTVRGKVKKTLKVIREPVKIATKKQAHNKVKTRKQTATKTAAAKKRKKKISAASNKAIMQRNFLPFVSLPLAAGSNYPSFALVPLGKGQIDEAVRAFAMRDRIVGKTTRIPAGAGQAAADTVREAEFEWDPYENPISEQVEEMFSFRVEPGDVYVKPEVWAKIMRALPENFVIPDPELTSFFDNMNAIHGVNTAAPESTSKPENQPSPIQESLTDAEDDD